MRFALRTLRNSPAYALTCLVVIALGIGANAAIFSVVYAVILKPLPFTDPSRLVFVWERFPAMPEPFGSRMFASRRNYLEWKRQNTVFTDMAALCEAKLIESGVEPTRHVAAGFANADLFRLLGIEPRIGRLFSAEEERKGSDRFAILSDSHFERRFNRDRAAIGKSITLAGTAYTVVGVLPAKFRLPATYEGMDQKKPEVWIPLSRLWSKEDDDTVRQLMIAARLKPAASLDQARTEMALIAGWQRPIPN